MPPVARVTDPTGHPGMLAGPGVPNVLVSGMPVCVLADTHSCATPPLAGPHPPTPEIKGSASVLVGGRPVARMGDSTGDGAPIVLGSPTVLVGG